MLPRHPEHRPQLLGFDELLVRGPVVIVTKYKQINSEGCKIVGEGGAHETDSCSHPKPGATRRLGGVVSHPQGAPQDASSDGLAGGRAGTYGLRDRPDRASKRGDGKTLAQALPGRGSRGLARCAPSGRAAQGYGGVPRAVGGGGTSPSEEPWAAVLFVDAAPSGRLHGRADRHQGRVRDRSGAPEGSGDRAQPSAAHHHEPRPRVRPQKRRSQRPATTSERQTISTTPRSST